MLSTVAQLAGWGIATRGDNYKAKSGTSRSKGQEDLRLGNQAWLAGFWDACEWLPCRDGKARPTEPGTFPLVDGVPQRMVLLKGYGNAVVQQVAAAFVKALIG